jgi:exopolyphosphatase / guanosine-5'-triphosphate,3'-diphosphate pyrophosphatase
VTERFLAADPPAVGDMAAAREYVARLVRGAVAEHPGFARRQGAGGSGAQTLVGLAGTVSALTRLSLGLVTYERARIHHARLSRSDISTLLGRLAALRVADRRELPGMEPERADIIVGGALVLLTVIDVLGFDELLVSESDILDGLVGELIGDESPAS